MDDLRRDLEEFGFLLAAEDYDNAVGLKDDVDTASIYGRYGHLHELDTLHFVKRACSAAIEADEAKRLRFLEMEVLGTVIGERFAEEDDALSSEETRATVLVDGVTIPYRDVGMVIRDEDDRARRRRLRDAEREVSLRFLPRVEDIERRSRAAVAELGYPDDGTRWERQHGIPLADADAMMGKLVEDTDATFTRALAHRLEQTEGLPLREAESHDVSHMMRAKAFDPHFPKEGASSSLLSFLKRLGFDVARMPNVKLDLEDRPKKDSRAFVLPARVPDDIRLVTRPQGGVDDWRALWHESGHLLHYALTPRELPYEWRYHGDGGVTESYAFLFEHLFENPAFLAEIAPTLDGEAKRDYLHYLGLEKLMSLRYYGRALRYDRWLAVNGLDGAPAKYVAWMTDALKVPANEVAYLSTDGFYGMWYVRAWLFEALHRRWMEREFGERWWTSAKAGAHLAAMYRQGSKPTIEDLARELGERVTIRPLLEDVERLLAA